VKLKLNKPIAFIDLETTGLNISTDRIVEIAILKLLPEGGRDTFIRKINPGIPVPPKVTAIHGLTDDDLKEMPSFDQLAPEIIRFIGNSDLAGFNIVKFDLPLLVEEFLRYGIDFRLKGRKVIDVQHIFHKMEKRDLAAAYRFYCGKTIENQHSAMYDIMATEEILHEQLKRYQQIGETVDELYQFTGRQLDRMVDLSNRMVYDENGDIVFNFGKYKGMRVFDVFAKDPSYYDWMMKGDFPRQTKNKLKELYFSWKHK